MAKVLYCLPSRNCNCSGFLSFSAAKIASVKTFGLYAVPFTEISSMFGVMPALNAGLPHQTLEIMPVGPCPRRDPKEIPREVEKSAQPSLSCSFDSHSVGLSV